MPFKECVYEQISCFCPFFLARINTAILSYLFFMISFPFKSSKLCVYKYSLYIPNIYFGLISGLPMNKPYFFRTNMMDARIGIYLPAYNSPLSIILSRWGSGNRNRNCLKVSCKCSIIVWFVEYPWSDFVKLNPVPTGLSIYKTLKCLVHECSRELNYFSKYMAHFLWINQIEMMLEDLLIARQLMAQNPSQ